MGRASGRAVTQPDTGCFFQQRYRQEFPVRRPVAAQGMLVHLFHERRQLEGHVMLAAQRGHRREFFAAAVKPEAGQIVTGEQSPSDTSYVRELGWSGFRYGR